MATTLLQPIEAPRSDQRNAANFIRFGRQRTAAALVALTVLAFLLLGYHPYAEDGGIYTAAVAARLDRSLFPAHHAWVVAHTRMAFFVPAAAGLLRVLHLPLETGLLLLQAAGLGLLLYAVLRLARTALQDEAAAWRAAALVAVAAGIPVAGTALYLVDPYVTARTFTTPLLLLSAEQLLRRKPAPALLFWTLAALLHPLMSCWGGLLLLLLWLRQRARSVRWILLLFALLAVAAACAFLRASADSPLTHALSISRAYWFPARWRWFEWLGAGIPMLALWLVARRMKAQRGRGSFRDVADACLFAGAFATLFALCFCRMDSHTSALARLQPLRTFHLIFALFVVLAGGWLLRALEKQWSGTACLILLLCAGGALFAAQRSLYPASAHLEWPGSQPTNRWEQAFLWVRLHTPKDAVIAADADYINAAGEDAQGMRAATLRSVLADRAKDGGIASVVPDLAADWQTGGAAQNGLDCLEDSERSRRLLPLGVSWIVLAAPSATRWRCPYDNGTVKVCALQ